MNHSSAEREPSTGTVSAFPILPDDPERLPDVPGGWTVREIELTSGTLVLHCPADPDQFLDDPGVVAENRRHDYMPYWAFLWPASARMAEAMASAPWPVGSPVLELGSGVGLVGLAALLRGDAVTFSDYDRTALHLCRLNARSNRLPDPSTLLLDWRSPAVQQFPVIIGCEVTYDAALHEPLLDLLDRMLTDDGICWLGDPGRSQAPPFHRLAMDRGYAVHVRNERGEPLNGPSTAGFQILELRRPVNASCYKRSNVSALA